jgi:hypothetical protein
MSNRLKEAAKTASFDVKIEIPGKIILDVKNISYDDAWDHCQLILKENTDDKTLQEYLERSMGDSFGFTGMSGNGYSVHISARGWFIKNAIDEYHTCGRRAETGMDSENSPFRHSGKNLDTWDLIGDDLCCSYCGSIKPSRVIELVKLHGPSVINVSDKIYKWYMRRDEIPNAGFGGIKYYRQHDTKEFIDELNKIITGFTPPPGASA